MINGTSNPYWKYIIFISPLWHGKVRSWVLPLKTQFLKNPIESGDLYFFRMSSMLLALLASTASPGLGRPS